MAKQHHYQATLTWTGVDVSGPAREYRGYSRNYQVAIEGKPTLEGSADPAFLGDPSLYNPEDMLLASISACHMLWYLHLCVVNDIVVAGYEDRATAVMEMHPNGSGAFTEAVLHPRITLESGDPDKALALHDEAHRMCFIANSVNFPVACDPRITRKD